MPIAKGHGREYYMAVHVPLDSISMADSRAEVTVSPVALLLDFSSVDSEDSCWEIDLG